MNWISVDDDHKPDEWAPVLAYSPDHGHFVATYTDGRWEDANTERSLDGHGNKPLGSINGASIVFKSP